MQLFCINSDLEIIDAFHKLDFGAIQINALVNMLAQILPWMNNDLAKRCQRLGFFNFHIWAGGLNGPWPNGTK